MSTLSRETIDRIMAELEIRPVLQYLNYRLDTVQETDSIFRCFCPIHHEQVLRTLTLDKMTKRVRCSFARCPGRNGGNLADLVALTKNISTDDALVDLAAHFNINLPAPSRPIETPSVEQPVSISMPPKEERRDLAPASHIAASAGKTPDIGLSELRAAAENEPEDLTALENKAALYRAGKRADLLPGALRKLGDTAREKGDFSRAAAAYGEYAILRPDDADARLLYAECLEQFEHHEEAVREMMEAALLLKAQERIPDALAACQKMRTLAPESEAVFSFYVQLLVDIERFEEAVEELRTRADNCIARAQTEAALKCYRRILEIDPGYDDIRMKFIEGALSGRVDNGILHHALRLIDGFVEKEMAILALGHMRTNSAKFPDAVAILEKANHLYGKLGYAAEANETALDLAEAHVSSGNPSAALECLASVVPSAGDPTVVLTRKARLLKFMGHKGEAAETLLLVIDHCERSGQTGQISSLFESAVQLDPENLRIYSYWFQHLARTGETARILAEGEALLSTLERHTDRESAEQILSILIEQGPERVEFLLAQADLLLKKNQPQKAQELLLQTAELLVVRQEFDPAVQVLQRLLRSDPQNLAGTELLADCRVRLGARPQALLSYQSLAEMYSQWNLPEKQLGILWKIAEVTPSDVRALQQMLGLYEQLGREEEALGIRRRLALLYVERKAYPKALEVCQAILGKSACDPFACEQTLLIHSAMRRPDLLRKKGLAFLEAAQECQNSETRSRVLKILAENFPDEEAFAEGVAENAHDSDEPNLDVFNSQIDAEQYAEARTTLTEAIGKSPLDLEMRRRLISLLQAMGLQEEAIAEVANISVILSDRGEYAEALRCIDEILALDPHNIRAQSLRAEIHMQMGEKDLALAEFRSLAARVESGPANNAAAIGDIPLKEPLPQSMEMLPIKSEYSFEQFVVGSNNNFAHATALAIARSPGGEFNPLFFYGEVGLGKTHLLHAIANHLSQSQPELRLLYTSSREFTNGLIDAIQNNTIRDFRELHKSADFLMIDDIQYLSEQERAQEEFFQIFNTLYQANRQIVLTSDRPPREIAHLEKRLRSRFGSGITVDIQSPDLETRIAILRRDVHNASLSIDDEVLAAIAQNIDSNIRDLKAALKQILARVRIANESPTPEMAAQIAEVILGQSRTGMQA